MSNEDIFKKVVSHCKEYGFVFQSSEIYDGLSAVYDYGQNGVLLKRNLREYWWKAMVQMNENIVGIDAAIFMHPKVWKASGHVDGFSDPMIDNKDSKKRYRADQLIEDALEKIKKSAIQKAIKDFEKTHGIEVNNFVWKLDGKETFNPILDFINDPNFEIPFKHDRKYNYDEQFYWLEYTSLFQATLENNVQEYKDLRNFTERFETALNTNNLPELKKIIEDLQIACPVSGTRNWTDVRQFNLMYSTQMGSVADDSDTVYLRPETAQGIFVNFLNVQKTGRMKIPFGIAQTGKAFRNEIIARQFIMRMREFEQMEMQFFVRPGTEMQWYEHWKQARMKWHLALGTSPDKYRFHDHTKLAHYANAAVDIEFEFPFGFKEVEGIHSRTDFDLKQHQEHSGKKMQYFDADLDESGKAFGNYIPYVIETSIGLDRLFLLTLCNAYVEEELPGADGKTDTRVVLRLHPVLAPVKLAIFPLTKKDGLPEKAREIMNDLKFDFECFYEEKDAIGKRYRRHDAIGTPFCITIDHESLVDDQVTIRYRDTMLQERVPIAQLKSIIAKEVDWRNVL